MSSLLDLIPSLKRSIATLGQFDTLFPTATTPELVGYLLDGIAEAQLDGFLSDYVVDDATESIAPDLNRGDGGGPTPAGALVLLYTAARVLDNEIRNLRTHVRYEAKGNVFEEDQTASLLIQLHKDMKERLKELREMARAGDAGDAIYVADLAFAKAVASYDERDLLASYSGAALRALSG